MPHKDKEAGRVYHNKWRAKHPEISARWRAKHPDQNVVTHRNSSAWRKYGISTHEELLKIRNQPCEICGQRAKKMCIDHDGPARKFNQSYRGVLCQQCNVRVGWLERYRFIIEEYLWRERRKRA